MNKVFFSKIHSISLIIALIGLLFSVKISSVFILLFSLLSVIKLFIDTDFKKKKPPTYIFIFVGVYVFYLIGFFYSSDTSYALKLLERNSSWLVIPLLIFFTFSMTNKEKNKILLPFAIATHIVAFFFLFVAIVRYYNTGESLVFYYREFTSVLDFHPIYFATYLLFSLAILVSIYTSSYVKVNKNYIVLLILIDAVFLLFLSSKNILLVFTVSSMYFLIKCLKKKKKLFFLPIIVGVMIFSMLKFSTTKERVYDEIFSKWELLSKEQFAYNDAFTGITLRLITWKFVVQKIVAEKRYFFGTGTGDAQDFIDTVYKEHNMDAAGYLGFNMHNQLLEYFVRFGFLGMLYFMFFLLVSFKKAVQNRDHLYVFFLILFFSVSITESNLEVHKGILFFVFMNSILFFNTFENNLGISKVECKRK